MKGIRPKTRIKYEAHIGSRFAKLTILALVLDKGKPLFRCQCDCGTVCEILVTVILKSNGQQTCGCGQGFVKHGHAGMDKSATYNAWDAMKQRVLNSSCQHYHNYGGRGIRICEAWMMFEAFLADMGERPQGLTLDRINNNGHYSCGKCRQCRHNGWPLNCRWATRLEQSRNTRRCKFVEYKGESKPVGAWAEQYDINAGMLNSRLRNGWPMDLALSAPKGFQRRAA